MSAIKSRLSVASPGCRQPGVGCCGGTGGRVQGAGARLLGRLAALSVFNSVGFYLMFVYIVTWLELVDGIPPAHALGINTISMAALLGFLGARFRDLAPVVSNVLQLMFFLSPILWEVSALGDKARLLVFNPVFVMIEIVRTPLLSGTINPSHWLAAGLLTLLNVCLATAMFVRFRDRVAYWI